ncbi:hypothetical protein [Flavicella sediminum]|uniref:hypothetical protein n=1 Tax=Flavicella sediminum TaxID=2585141 RepID=UPI001124A960|nr:hypothetical protein [Flavicella sediminum]
MNLKNRSVKTIKICLFFSLLVSFFSSCTIETGGTGGDDSVYFSKLKTPEVTFTNNALVWEDVKNALLYEVLKDGVKVNHATSPHVIRSESQNGEYTVRSIPNHKLNRYLASEATEPITVAYVTPVKIAAPSLTFNDNVLSWDESIEASEYIVYKNDTEVAKVATNSYVLKADTYNGEYKVSIVVKSSSRVWLDSDLSAGLTVSFTPLIALATPNVTYATNTLSWNGVTDAESYTVFKDGLELTVVSGALTYDIADATFNGEYTVIANPSDTSTTLKQSAESNKVTVVFN